MYLFTFSPFITAAGTDQEDAEDLCESLARRHQIVRPADSREFAGRSTCPRYEFVHTMYREVLYNRQSPRRRKQIHLQVGEQLEELYSQRLGEIAPELTHHFQQGEDWLRAIKYLQLAADTAGRRLEPRRAAEILQHAIELVKKLPDEKRAQQETTILAKLAKIYVEWAREASKL